MRLALHRILRKLQRTLTVGPVPLETAFVPAVPGVLRKDTVYLVTEENDPWTVVMRCPCGCSEALYMSLIKGSPRWAFEYHPDGTVSLHPSVWRTGGCRSHFFLRKGRISWCRA